jgi:hypothetical protein
MSSEKNGAPGIELVDEQGPIPTFPSVALDEDGRLIR